MRIRLYERDACKKATTTTAAATTTTTTVYAAAAVWEASTAFEQPTSISPFQPPLPAFLPCRHQLLDPAPHAKGHEPLQAGGAGGGRGVEGEHEDEHEEAEGHRCHGRHQVQPVLITTQLNRALF